LCTALISTYKELHNEELHDLNSSPNVINYDMQIKDDEIGTA